MATFVTHPLIGAAVADLVKRRDHDARRFVLASAICHWLPDLDSLAYLTSIDELSPWAHRGFSHSLLLAAVIGLVAARLFDREARGQRRLGLSAWFIGVTALHGAVDALVDGSIGVAFLWPFDATRYLFSWRPLVDAPVSLRALSGSFWHALLVEAVMFGGLYAFLKLSRAAVERGRRGVPALNEAVPEAG